VAVLSDRADPDAVGQCGRLLESFADSVVLLSSKPDPSVLLGCMGEGARSFVMEGDPPELLLAAIRAAARGATYLGPRTLDMLVDWLAQGERSDATRRQRRLDDDLLRLLAQGRTTEEIASALGIAPKTVRNRASRLYRRLGVHSRAAAVRLAEQRGLIR
jgi:DNA-binding NarL/FixJ family response regulator